MQVALTVELSKREEQIAQLHEINTNGHGHQTPNGCQLDAAEEVEAGPMNGNGSAVIRGLDYPAAPSPSPRYVYTTRGSSASSRADPASATSPVSST